MTATIQIQNVSYQQVQMAIRVLEAMGLNAVSSNEENKIPNETTLLAMKEAQEIMKDNDRKTFSDVDEFLDFLKN